MALIPMTRPQLALACATGTSCLIGAPTAIYFNSTDTQEKDGETRELSELYSEKHTPQQITMEFSDEISQRNSETGEKNNANLEEVWAEINRAYIEKQSEVQRKERGLNWKEEFKAIWEKEQNTGTLRLVSQEWKDCKAIGGQDAYCGFLSFERGDAKYRLKVDRYSTSGKEWEATLIKEVGTKIKWYDGIGKNWRTENHSINKFGGANTMANNWWVKITGTSITK
ncbi:hypothetical protein [Candidatus Mycoplasma haematominutum]|uniref:Uncharacterized protein n=1 Tax=Candidatus Mycoplasma haematominutum 'Birmingham 1' TaxID=1116213 RepID=G8C2U5_9MOLU|nr:hypothetical protein [Candidatus Mycoplasma haematominutum]CCE66643.1 hypothetical protein MHM_01250 [Candidatus Mycoplasma haematominutum 'Birmingham 1']